MKFIIFLLSLLIPASIILYAGVFIVEQTEYAFRLQFGSPIGKIIKKPGIHLSIPFIQTIKKYDNRILDFTGDSNLLPTKDKKYIYVDSVARWKITNPLTFYQTIGTLEKGQQIMDGIIDSAVGGIVSRYPLVETVRSSDNILNTPATDPLLSQGAQIEKIEVGRAKLQEEIKIEAKKDLIRYGIELIDVRLKKITLEEKVRQKVFDRMISERKKMAQKTRSEGQGKKAEIEGRIEKETRRLMSEATQRVLEIKASADAKALQIYADAYQQDIEFYQFYRHLLSYERTLKGKTTLMMSSNDDYFRLLSGKSILQNKSN